MVAVVGIELEEGLGLVGIAGGSAEGGPAIEDGIGFGREVFEEAKGAFAEFVAVFFFSVKKEKRHEGIDEEEVYEVATRRLGATHGGFVELKSVLPVGAGLYLEEVFQFAQGLGFYDFGKEVGGAVH